MNSLEKVKLYYEYTEDDAFHDLLVRREQHNRRHNRRIKVVKSKETRKP